MLPAQRRVRRREDFGAAVRDGRRAGSAHLVVHLRTTPSGPPARAGFVVSRAVGSAVRRNRIRRQLRHLMAARLAELPSGTDVVIRVTPEATGLSRHDLGHELDRLLARVRRSEASA